MAKVLQKNTTAWGFSVLVKTTFTINTNSLQHIVLYLSCNLKEQHFPKGNLLANLNSNKSVGEKQTMSLNSCRTLIKLDMNFIL